MAAPPASKSPIVPIGASSTGSASGIPRTLVPALTLDTSRPTRGTKRSASSAARFARSVASVPAPPETYSQISGGSAARAASSTSPAVANELIGTTIRCERPMDRADLAFAGLSRHADLIAAGELSSRELVELFLERIDRLDPLLNAFRVVLREQALASADQADGRRRAGDRRPLLGVPIAIKDDLHVAGEVTAYGCDADPPRQPADHEVVRRVRAAGAVILGKTHVPELMATAFTESPTFGVTRNPWDVHRTPGGSSGGSAAAVAAGLASAALGTDGAGSIRIPAACCGIFGLKPQRGRISTAPGASHPHRGMTVYGPLARTVEDAARLADVLKDGGPSLRRGRRGREPGKLRIAISVGLPPLGVKPDAEQLGGVQADGGAAARARPRGRRARVRLGRDGRQPRAGALPARRGGHGASSSATATGCSRRARGIARIGTMIPPAWPRPRRRRPPRTPSG